MIGVTERKKDAKSFMKVNNYVERVEGEAESCSHRKSILLYMSCEFLLSL